MQHVSGISKGRSDVFQINWPDTNFYPGNLQSCKYSGKVIGEINSKARLEVCRFLVSLFIFVDLLLTHISYIVYLSISN